MLLPEEYKSVLSMTANRRQWFAPIEDDLAWILWFLEEVHPARILEYGSGFSTLLIQQWAKANDAHSESLEEDPLFYITAKLETSKAIGRDFLRRLLFSPVYTKKEEGFRKIHYSYRLMSYPQFVYVDGPAIIFEEQLFELNLDPRAAAVALFDGRNTIFEQCKKAYPKWVSYHDNDRGILANFSGERGQKLINKYKERKAVE